MNYYDALYLIKLLSLLGISASREAEMHEDTLYEMNPMWINMLEQDWEVMGDDER
jgi:hypothetical protein